MRRGRSAAELGATRGATAVAMPAGGAAPIAPRAAAHVSRTSLSDNLKHTKRGLCALAVIVTFCLVYMFLTINAGPDLPAEYVIAFARGIGKFNAKTGHPVATIVEDPAIGADTRVSTDPHGNVYYTLRDAVMCFSTDGDSHVVIDGLGRPCDIEISFDARRLVVVDCSEYTRGVFVVGIGSDIGSIEHIVGFPRARDVELDADGTAAYFLPPHGDLDAHEVRRANLTAPSAADVAHAVATGAIHEFIPSELVVTVLSDNEIIDIEFDGVDRLFFSHGDTVGFYSIATGDGRTETVFSNFKHTPLGIELDSHRDLVLFTDAYASALFSVTINGHPKKLVADLTDIGDVSLVYCDPSCESCTGSGPDECATCPAGAYLSRGKCYDCATSVYQQRVTWPLFVVMIILLLLATLFCNDADSMGTAMLGMVPQYCQVFLVVVQSYGAWPSAMHDALMTARTLADITIFSPACTPVGGTYYRDLAVSGMCVAAVFTVLLLVNLVTLNRALNSVNRGGNVGAAARSRLSHIQHLLSEALKVMFVPVVVMLTDTMVCKKGVDGYFHLAKDMRYKCFDAGHVLIMLLTLAFLVVAGDALRRVYESLRHNRRNPFFRHVVKPYARGSEWYLAVTVLCRAILSVASHDWPLPDLQVWQSALAIGVIGVQLFLAGALQPHATERVAGLSNGLNAINIALLGTQWATSWLMLAAAKHYASADTTFMWGVVLSLLASVFTALLAFAAARRLFQSLGCLRHVEAAKKRCLRQRVAAPGPDDVVPLTPGVDPEGGGAAAAAGAGAAATAGGHDTGAGWAHVRTFDTEQPQRMWEKLGESGSDDGIRVVKHPTADAHVWPDVDGRQTATHEHKGGIVADAARTPAPSPRSRRPQVHVSRSSRPALAP